GSSGRATRSRARCSFASPHRTCSRRRTRPPERPRAPTSEVMAPPPAVRHAGAMPTPPTLDTAGLHALVPLAATLGLRVASAAPDSVRVELDHRPELCTPGGVPRRGALVALAGTPRSVCG